MTAAAEPPLLEARGIVKRFGSLVANDVARFDVRPGEVVGLLGENGAGKSTLAKILYGYYAADAGEVLVDGSAVKIASPSDARALGIGMVFQNFTLIPAMSVFENVALFQTGVPAPRAAIMERLRRGAERLQLTVDPWTPARALAVGDQQKVEILKQLLAGARILILDEPTKVLAPQESAGLFRSIDELRADGLGIVLISHKLNEVLACADRIAVMRHGRVAGVLDRAEASRERLLGLMFGEAIAAPATARPDVTGAADHALELIGVSTSGDGGRAPLRDVSMTVRSGEIVGIAGVSGNGQRELGDVVTGVQKPQAGTRRLWNEDASRWSVAQLRAKGVAMIPDDPLAFACVADLTVRENLALGSGRRYRSGLGVDWQSLDADMQKSFARLGFPRPNFEARAATLSGGNLQRLVLARELAHRPSLIVALYPTRGLDARSTAAVHAVLRGARDGGAAVLLISEELDELFELSDRLLVMFHGAIAGEFAAGNFRTEAIGPLMVGTQGLSHAA